jgi:hypothetical protein
MEYSVNGKTLRYLPSNEAMRGDDVVILDHARDLTQGQPWHKPGFIIEKLFYREDDYAIFISACRELLYRCWREAGLNVPADFPLEHYHLLANNPAMHLAAIERTRLVSLDNFPISIQRITDRVATILNTKVEGCNPFDDQRVFHFRVVRPCSGDNNPLHRDVWLEDYSDCINLYIPLAGSNSQSSLILLPGSHLWPESRMMRTAEGAVIDGIRFNVPAVTSIDGDYNAIRPDPGQNEFLLFSPYLVHGGATNFNENETRISIELRLWPV